MIEILQQYGVYGFILMVALAYFLGTKKSIKNLENRICAGIEEHTGFKDVCEKARANKDKLDKVETKANDALTFKKTHLYDTTRLENKIKALEKGLGSGITPEENEEIQLLKEEMKQLKKQIKKLSPDKKKNPTKTI